jgi:uncharacterized YigZ family protein
MFTCNTDTTETLEVKQSKFIAHIMPYEHFATVLDELKKAHPKARHFVTAFRYLNEHEQIVEGSSDDGEPKGTSGKPSLHVLQGNNLINIGVIIVRYFGGTKLGTGGLVRAYSDAVNLVISAVNLIEYEKKIPLTFACTYNNLSKIEYILTQENIDIINKEFTASEVILSTQATSNKLESVKVLLERQVRFI